MFYKTISNELLPDYSNSTRNKTKPENIGKM